MSTPSKPSDETLKTEQTSELTEACVDDASLAAYSEMIRKVARAMASNQVDPVLPYLATQYEPKHVEMFVDGNFDKRIDVLLRLMPFVNEDEDFVDLEEDAVEFCEVAAVSAYDGSSEECDAFLAWLEESRELTPEQRDTVEIQRCRYRIEQKARTERPAHVRFQELVSLAPQLFEELDENPELQLMVNPVTLWSELKSNKYLAAEAVVPVPVLHYADDREVRTGMFEPAGVTLLKQLLLLTPCTFLSWSAVTDADPEELRQFLAHLIQLRLVAIR